MTDPAIIAASYAAERNYSHNPDDVIDASDAVGAWGTTKESTTKLSDISGNNNIADIHGAMPAEGFIKGRRFNRDNSNYLDCGNDSSLDITGDLTLISIIYPNTAVNYEKIFGTKYAKNDNTRPYEIAYDANKKASFVLGNGSSYVTLNTGINSVELNKYSCIIGTINGTNMDIYLNGSHKNTATFVGTRQTLSKLVIGASSPTAHHSNMLIISSIIFNRGFTEIENKQFFNTLAHLPFWSVNYPDYPNNVTEYTDNLPYSSSIISSGTFKVDDDVLNCVSAGTMTYSASYEFDGSEFIKVTIGGVEYAGTGTITQGNTTVSVAQGSNKVTIVMGTGDTIDSIMVQFREEV